MKGLGFTTNFLTAAAYQESRFAEFTNLRRCGPTVTDLLALTDGYPAQACDNGYGIMQLTQGVPGGLNNHLNSLPVLLHRTWSGTGWAMWMQERMWWCLNFNGHVCIAVRITNGRNIPNTLVATFYLWRQTSFRWKHGRHIMEDHTTSWILQIIHFHADGYRTRQLYCIVMVLNASLWTQIMFTQIAQSIGLNKHNFSVNK